MLLALSSRKWLPASRHGSCPSSVLFQQLLCPHPQLTVPHFPSAPCGPESRDPGQALLAQCWREPSHSPRLGLESWPHPSRYTATSKTPCRNQENSKDLAAQRAVEHMLHTEIEQPGLSRPVFALLGQACKYRAVEQQLSTKHLSAWLRGTPCELPIGLGNQGREMGKGADPKLTKEKGQVQEVALMPQDTRWPTLRTHRLYPVPTRLRISRWCLLLFLYKQTAL